MPTKRNRHQKKTPTSQMDAFKQKILREDPLLSEEKLLVNTSKPKISQALTSFIAPYADAAETNEEYEKLFTLAVIAWNATLMDDEAQKELIEKTVIMHIDGETTRAILNTFMERKALFFADDKRIVADFKITNFKDGRRHLAVAARIPKSQND